MMEWILRILEREWEALRQHLLRGSSADEEAAFVYCGVSATSNKTVLLGREIVAIPDSAMVAKGRAGITIDPNFIAPIVKRCRHEGLALLQTHSHPFSRDWTTFSGIDDAGEVRLFPPIQRRAQRSVLGALVFGQQSFDGRVWPLESSTSVPLKVAVVIGDSLREIHPSSQKQIKIIANDTYDRQLRVIGSEAQNRISNLSVGVVGLGGTGSHVVQQLSYLGVRNFILVDPDTVEESNLSRLIGGTLEDVGEPKVSIMERVLRSLGPSKVDALQGDVYHESFAKSLRKCDVLFCCTDSLTSRMVLTRLASQYLIPLIDMGINIQLSSEGTISRIGGRVMTQLPGDPCLDCMGILNPDALVRELMSVTERQANPYIQGAEDERAPAVVSLNGVVSSLAVTEFLHLVSGRLGSRFPRTFQMYDGLKGTVRLISLKPEKRCGVCDEVRAMGDLIPLPCLQNK